MRHLPGGDRVGDSALFNRLLPVGSVYTPEASTNVITPGQRGGA